MIASDLVEESLEIADQAEERGVPAARLRVEQRRWMAGGGGVPRRGARG